MALIFLHPKTPRNNMKEFMDLDLIKSFAGACAASFLLFICVTAAIGQELTVDVDAKKPQATAEKADKIEKTEKSEKAGAAPIASGAFLNVVSKYNSFVKGNGSTISE